MIHTLLKQNILLFPFSSIRPWWVSIFHKWPSCSSILCFASSGIQRAWQQISRIRSWLGLQLTKPQFKIRSCLSQPAGGVYATDVWLTIATMYVTCHTFFFTVKSQYMCDIKFKYINYMNKQGKNLVLFISESFFSSFIDQVWIWYLQSTYPQQYPKVIDKKKKKLKFETQYFSQWSLIFLSLMDYRLKIYCSASGYGSYFWQISLLPLSSNNKIKHWTF